MQRHVLCTALSNTSTRAAAPCHLPHRCAHAPQTLTEKFVAHSGNVNSVAIGRKTSSVSLLSHPARQITSWARIDGTLAVAQRFTRPRVCGSGTGVGRLGLRRASLEGSPIRLWCPRSAQLIATGGDDKLLNIWQIGKVNCAYVCTSPPPRPAAPILRVRALPMPRAC